MTTAAPKGHRRFLTLDALRGMGAITVMVSHTGMLLGGYCPPSANFVVDMFYVLSGFVLARSYDEKFLKGMSVLAFAKARISRLYSTFLIGLVLGLISLPFFNPHALSVAQGATSFLFGVFVLPSPPMGPLGALFPLNGPFWSLFFELWVANLLFAVFWRHLRGKLLWVVILSSALMLLLLGAHLGTLDFGWTWRQFPGGFARVCYSFFVGVALSRFHLSRRHASAVPSLVFLLIFAIIMLVPVNGPLRGPYELVIVLFAFPALIYFGADAVESRPEMGKALGNVSYTIYAIHRPLIAILAWPLGTFPFAASQHSYALGVEAVIASIIGVLAWGISRLLSARRATKVSRNAQVPA